MTTTEQSAPTIGETISQMRALSAQPKPKQLENRLSNVAQPAVSGNPSVT